MQMDIFRITKSRQGQVDFGSSKILDLKLSRVTLYG